MAINRRFKIGDQVRFTQKAKDRFEDKGYWHYANFPQINLNGVYTVKRVNDKNWPSVYLGQGTAPHTPTYLLEPAETQKNMQKKDFILALARALFPGLNNAPTYSSCSPYVKVQAGMDTVTVKYSKNYGDVQLTFSLTYGTFGETDIELVTKFLDQNCDLNCPEDAIKVTDNGDLVMNFEDYPWHMVDKIKPLEQSPTKEALQAEVQQLKAENERLKAQTYTIEIPQGVTSICLNLKG